MVVFQTKQSSCIKNVKSIYIKISRNSYPYVLFQFLFKNCKVISWSFFSFSCSFFLQMNWFHEIFFCLCSTFFFFFAVISRICFRLGVSKIHQWSYTNPYTKHWIMISHTGCVGKKLRSLLTILWVTMLTFSLRTLY